MSRRSLSLSSLFGKPVKKAPIDGIIDLAVEAEKLPNEILALVNVLVKSDDAKQGVKESLALLSHTDFDPIALKHCVTDMTHWMLNKQETSPEEYAGTRALAAKIVSALQALEEAQEANSSKSSSPSSGIEESPNDSDDDALLPYNPSFVRRP